MRPRRFAPMDKDLAGALAALKRAAAVARRLSLETGTPFYVLEDGRVVDRNPPRRKHGSRRARSSSRSRLDRRA
jgi:hypothetical protein